MQVLNALRQLRKHLCYNTEQEHCENMYYYELVEKRVIASDIILDKLVNIFKIRMCDTVEEYNRLRNTGSELTEDEFNLIKEVDEYARNYTSKYLDK